MCSDFWSRGRLGRASSIQATWHVEESWLCEFLSSHPFVCDLCLHVYLCSLCCESVPVCTCWDLHAVMCERLCARARARACSSEWLVFLGLSSLASSFGPLPGKCRIRTSSAQRKLRLWVVYSALTPYSSISVSQMVLGSVSSS